MLAPVVQPPCEAAALRAAPETPGCAAHAKRWVLTVAIFGSCIAFTEATILNVSLPAVQHGLGASMGQMQWIASAYTLVIAALTLLGGAVGDRYGRRLALAAGLSIFTLASVLCYGAPTAATLVAGRALQGLGAAFMTPNSLALISASFPRAERGRAVGLWSAATALTGGAAPLIGGWLVDTVSWRSIFMLAVPPSVLALAITLTLVPESRAPGRHGGVDGRGAVTATFALAALTYGLISAGSRGWNDLTVAIALAAGSASFAAFLWLEARVSAPLMPLGVFRSRTFNGANLLTLLLYGAVAGAFFLLPFNLVQVHGYSATLTGAAYLPFALSIAALSRWAGGLLDRYGARLPLVGGPAIAATGLALLAWPDIGGSYWHTFFAPMALIGIGMGITAAPLTASVMAAVEPARAGVAASVNSTVARMAGLFAVALVGVVALPLFNRAFALRIERLALPPPAVAALTAERRAFGDIRIPDLPGIDAAQVHHAVRAAFVDSFRAVALGAAACAAAGALCAGLLLRGRPALATTDEETAECEHVADIGAALAAERERQAHPVAAPENACAACQLIGARWIHLRQCLTCGFVGCCDASRHQHATTHFRATGHPIVRSLAPGEHWRWCYLDDRVV